MWLLLSAELAHPSSKRELKEGILMGNGGSANDRMTSPAASPPIPTPKDVGHHDH